MRIKVTVRKKAISKGRHSLYLDFWPPVPHPQTGKPTRREFLRLYTIDSPLSYADREHNKEMMNLAEDIRNHRVLNLNRSKIHPDPHKRIQGSGEVLQQDFLAYFRSLAEAREGKNSGIWISVLRYLKKFSGGPIPFAELNEQKIADFKEYLDSRYLAQNTKASYFTRIRTALKQAFRDGLLQEDLNAKITGIKEQNTPRAYLTLEELNKLAVTPCKDAQLRRAGLFSALTGMKFIDLEQLTWHQVRQEGNRSFLKIRRLRTGEPESHPISSQAFELLGPAGKSTERVFPGLYKSVYNNSALSHWLEDAGIKKNMTFSGFRNSYAVNQLFLGTDIYTVSKMLMHRDLKSTMVYAKIADELKNIAANRIRLDMGNK
jgi:site-specific recombinase XerD